MSGKIARFEDLVAWQKARTLAAEIYKVTNEGKFAKDWALTTQIRRACVSVLSNIAEGFERGRPSEFHQFLSVAKGSCAELRSQLYVAFDASYVDSTTFNHLLARAEEVGRLLGGLRASVQKRRDNG